MKGEEAAIAAAAAEAATEVTMGLEVIGVLLEAASNASFAFGEDAPRTEGKKLKLEADGGWTLEGMVGMEEGGKGAGGGLALGLGESRGLHNGGLPRL